MPCSPMVTSEERTVGPHRQHRLHFYNPMWYSLPVYVCEREKEIPVAQDLMNKIALD